MSAAGPPQGANWSPSGGSAAAPAASAGAHSSAAGPSRALIGHTGFVGGNLARQARYDATFNSANIDAMRGRIFERVVCAGVSAVKWLANRDPERDIAGIRRLADVLATIGARQFVLISTIDVYPVLDGADESYDCAAADNHPYGRHRLWLEQRVRECFPAALIVRLPALFGSGLKKNVLHDLLHDSLTDAIQPDSEFQWYDVDRLDADIRRAEAAALHVVNLFPAPLATRAIIERCFPNAKVGANAGPPIRYALRTRHAELFGGAGGYIAPAPEVLDAIARFVDRERGSA
jgi:hypothetical protein